MYLVKPKRKLVWLTEFSPTATENKDNLSPAVKVMLAPDTDLMYTVSTPEVVTTFVTIAEIAPVGTRTKSSLRA